MVSHRSTRAAAKYHKRANEASNRYSHGPPAPTPGALSNRYTTIVVIYDTYTTDVINPVRSPRLPEPPLKFQSVLQTSRDLLCRSACLKAPIGQSRADGITMPKGPRLK
ncbi:hypothetical protein EVAR_7232_1 [Eumeta japonica]|uniref:Uncharacterized protein n=1 Tax=Eumeta variegata TaxID=151549 RepID=A0A4C1T366_EUMVA|nr:hypothetical protein EVAR_7232_1 [Eumeta japonica]